MKKDGTVDLRIKRTKKAIKDAFFYLIEEKGFEHITVKDITDRATISRNTFYLHYNDKYDLLNKICDDLMTKLFIGVGKQLRKEQRLRVDVKSAARIIQIGIRIINNDREAYRVLLSSSGTDVLAKKIYDLIRRYIDLIRGDIEGISNYSIEYFVAGMTGVIKYYVTHELDNIEEETLNFAKLHLSSIIDVINTQRRV